MEEQLISFETAKLAKEKGFDWSVRYTYSEAGLTQVYNPAIPENMNDGRYAVTPNVYSNPPYYSAPTQSLLQKWIRDVHNIYTTVIPSYVNNELVKDAFLFENPHLKKVNQCKNYYPTYEEALEHGLIEALKMINV